LSFTSTGAGSVARWTVSLDGRKVTSRAKSGRGRATSRIGRVGKHRWTVVGYDASGRQVARGQRNFRAFRAR
jgi:hypothetical protein